MHFDTPAWREIDKLVDEQKLEAAREKLGVLRDRARQESNYADWTRALIRDAQLQAALGGAETAVRTLREADWPEDGLSQLLLELYYAETLMRYLDLYSWEISQREQIESQAPLDIKAIKLWTREQILAEALASLQRAWSQREALGVPADILGPYLQQNNYPEGIRDTLRDVLSYHIAELLADTRNWRPAEQNELFRLDHAALLQGQVHAEGEGGKAGIAVGDARVHPLARAVYVLSDLAAWHLQQGRAEAALEAQLARLRLLHREFTQDDERKAQTQALQALLDRNRALPWWSMAQLELARWSRERDELVLARAQAEAGASAYPQSLGARACQQLIAEIEAPEFSLTAMAVDGPKRRSIEVRHRNVEQLYFRAYRRDVRKRIEQMRGVSAMGSVQELRALLGGKPDAAWQVSLPNVGDYAEHRSYVSPPLDALGYYVIFASREPSFADGSRVDATSLSVSGLVLRHRTHSHGHVEVQVLDGDTGAPAQGAEVLFYKLNWRTGAKRVATQAADAAGFARFDRGAGGDGSYVLLAQRGDDICAELDNVWLGAGRTPGLTSSAFVFTDRSIYRPEQKLHWKLLAYRGREADWKNLVGESVTVSLHDANGEEVEKTKVTTNAYGTAFGDFDIPAGRLLGQWSIRSSLGSMSAIQIEEYKRPTFEVKLLPSQQPARLNHPVSVQGEASYYFGLAVQNMPVRFKVERRERYPWWWGFWRPPLRAPQVVASGESRLDGKGQFQFEFTPSAPAQAEPGLQYSYHVVAEVTDEGGETRSATRDFTLGHVAVDAHLSLEGGFVVAGTTGKVSLSRENLDGEPRPGSGRYRIVALQAPAAARLPAELPVLRDPKDNKPHTQGDDQRSRHAPGYSAQEQLASWQDGAEVAAADISTDADGHASIALPALVPGAYRIHYETQDEFGAKLAVKSELVVADDKTQLPLPALLLLERSTVPSGEVARVLATTGLTGQGLWLEIYAGDELLERRPLPPGAPAVHEIKIGPKQRGGISLALVGLRDYQPLTQRASLFVPWDERELSLEFSSFRDLLRPGQTETFRVTVRSKRDRSLVAAAELLAYMYDRSLDAFVPHTPPVPLDLYPKRLWEVPLGWNVGASHSQSVFYRSPRSSPGVDTVDLRGDALEFPDPYAFGGPGRRGYAGGVMARPMSLRQSAAMPSPASNSAEEAAPMAVAEKAEARPTLDRAAAADESRAADQGTTLRSNFAETAFFLPQLITGKDGSAAIEFSVPDSVTSWNVWVHAITQDFRSGSVHRETRSVKDLLVRPYLPRFVREADRVALKVVVHNASTRALTGKLSFELFDPSTKQSLNAEFGVQQTSWPLHIEPDASTPVTIPIVAPRRVGDVAVRVLGQAGDLSDGEQRPLPVLPSRLHLTQSKSVTLRGDGSTRQLQLPDLADSSDPTRTSEQLVVTVEAQLFMTVLKALPFLVDYPYECSEQTLNRFLSAGIVASVFDKHPAVKQLARDLAQRRDTLLDKFDADDPNRSLLLQESPWLVEAKGGPALDDRLIKVLDPEVATRERDRALGRLSQMQTASGGFPWFAGGPPSPYMTLYLMIGLARASEFDVAVPKPMVQRAWQYLAEHYREQIVKDMARGAAPVEMVTLLRFATTAYADASYLGGAFTPAETQQMLDYAFERWKQLPPLLKSVLTTTLLRAGRRADAKLVFDSVMDSAKTTEDEGTFWQPEDRAWLWYNDTIETHAYALRTLLELDDKDPKLDGMVVWLLLHKKLNQWKSTRATAEVIYSLAQYLERKSAIGAREEVTLKLGNRAPQTLTFEPTQYTGKSQVVIPGAQVQPQDASLEASKRGQGVAFVTTSWHYATDQLPSEARGDLFRVKRSYFKREAMGQQTKLTPLGADDSLSPGDEVEVQLEIEARAQAEYVHLRDPRPAGLEPPAAVSGYHFDLGLVYYEEIRDSAQNFFIEWLPAGQYTLKYRLRANLAGKFRVGPATLQSMYAPEFAGFSAGRTLQVQ